jgi:hypothetical protein
MTWRAVVIGLASAAFFAAFTPYNDIKIGATMISGNQFPVGALLVELFLVFVVNVALRRTRPDLAFTPAELLTVWTLILVASGIPSGGMMRFLIPHIVAPHYHSNAANGWEAKVWGAAPDWLKIRDPAAVKAFYEGYPRGEEHVPWGAWIVPLLTWGLLAALFLAASFCIASLLRRQWVEHEKFAFPLVSVPLLVSEEPEPGRLLNRRLRSPLLWIAVLATTVLHGMKGLHLLYPTVPDIPLQWNLIDYLPSPPWSQLDLFPIALYPLMIGLTYLLPREVAFSFWFFFLFYKFEILLCALFNWQMPGVIGAHGYKQFHALQSFGGGLGLLCWAIWTGRGHLRRVWQRIGRTEPGADDDESREMLSYRATALGLVGSYGGIALWLALARVPLPFILLSLFLMTLIIVVISWMVCQAGMLFVQTAYGSIDLIAPIRGTAGLPLPALYTQYRFESSFFLNTREMVAPSVLEGAKAANVVGFSARRLFWGMAASVALTVVISAAASLILPYYGGGAAAIDNDWVYNAAPKKPLNLFGGAASVPIVGSWVNWLHILGGFLGVLGLLACRAYLGFGLHPIGFLGASVNATHALYFSMFLGWLFKSLILRYGGMRLYARLLPFFLGLILGDALNAALWIVLGVVLGTGYRILP